jgi:hypothetical protein
MRRNRSANSPKDGRQRQEEQAKLKKRTEVTDYDTDGNKMQSSETDEPEKEKPKEPMSLKKVLTRSATASVMALLYLSIIYAGHFYCMLAVILTQVRFPNHFINHFNTFSMYPIFQTEIYREIVNVRYVEARERAMPWFRTLQWGWFLVAMVYVCKFFLLFFLFLIILFLPTGILRWRYFTSFLW